MTMADAGKDSCNLDKEEKDEKVPSEVESANVEMEKEENSSSAPKSDEREIAHAVGGDFTFDVNPNVILSARSGVLSMLQNRLGRLLGQSSGYVESLPLSARRSLNALKKLQLECTKLEAEFYHDVYKLECKYARLYTSFQEKRAAIINGDVEPTDEECDLKFDVQGEDATSQDDSKETNGAEKGDVEKDSAETDSADKDISQEKDSKRENPEQPDEKDAPSTKTDCPPEQDLITGVPEFWLTTLKNIAITADMIETHDEPILKKLRDMKVKFNESSMGFTLEFHFEPNDYFTNAVLTKEYDMKCAPDDKDPFAFDGPEIVKCKGCSIDWKAGKNVTVKTIKKKQKHKSRGSIRTVTKTVRNDSFFNFFSPPAIPEPGESVDAGTEALISSDFEIGHFLKDRVIPRAVLYFTGEALMDVEDEVEEEDDEEEDDGDEDDDSDPDYKVDKQYLKKHIQPPECKQQ